MGFVQLHLVHDGSVEILRTSLSDVLRTTTEKSKGRIGRNRGDNRNKVKPRTAGHPRLTTRALWRKSV